MLITGSKDIKDETVDEKIKINLKLGEILVQINIDFRKISKQ